MVELNGITIADNNIYSKRNVKLYVNENELSKVSSPTEKTIPEEGLAPNTIYDIDKLSGNVTINLAESTGDSTNHYFIIFNTGNTAPNITWGSGITAWYGGSAPTISANKHYEISILNGIAIAIEI